MRRTPPLASGFRPLALNDLYLVLSKIRYRQYPQFVASFENQIVDGFLRLIPGWKLHSQQANRAYDRNVDLGYWVELPRITYSGRSVRVFSITEKGWIHALNVMDWNIFSHGMNRLFGSPSHAA